MGMLTRVLVANRGEIAIRVMRAAGDLGIESVAIYAEDDADTLHTRRAARAVPLRGTGPAAYLDAEQVIRAATDAGCDGLHPGYGFLAENAELARRCDASGLAFVGPDVRTLSTLGDKVAARAVAARCGLPVLEGTEGALALEDAKAFLDGLGPGGAVMIKAVAGGGGRGMRPVRDVGELDGAMAQCRREALAAFGDDAVYLERMVPGGRHVEVQVLGDGSGAVSHLYTRDCSLQRRRQKLIEIAPAPCLSDQLRDELHDAAVRMASELSYRGAGTVELLVAPELDRGYAFLEVNARLQVEHTVTEETTGVDLVQAQLRIAGGATLAELGLTQDRVPPARGVAVQVRINAETLHADGTAAPSTGTITVYEIPSGPGIRVDGAGWTGYRSNPRYDSLLAKVVAWSPEADPAAAIARAARAVGEVTIEGLDTNIALLSALLSRPELATGQVTTTFVDDHLGELLPGSATAEVSRPPRETTEGTIEVRAPLTGTVGLVLAEVGELVSAGQPLLVLEAMKMEHEVCAPASGRVQRLAAVPAATVAAGEALVVLVPETFDRRDAVTTREVDLDHVRPDLAAVVQRHTVGLDAARPEAVARRRATGQRTARENVHDLCDPGTFVEYGPLVIAAQRRRRPVDDLIARTPADGLVAGVGTVNGSLFGEDRARCVVMSYDYTVLAGTQGHQNHRKKDRLFELAERSRLPVVFFTEGGGGRPGDTDVPSGVAGLDCMAFHLWGRLSGLVPLVGINSGRCFAGNAAILGCCDVVIATADSTIGMGGPAMIEGGGLGVYRPEEVGPMAVQVPAGVVDIAVADEAEAVAEAKRYLSYFQGPVPTWEASDQRLLRTLVPENRLRVYDVRRVIDTLVDTGSVLELRRGFGPGMVTTLARIAGRPIGIVANDPTHLGGAIDTDGSDKAARFMQLCDAFDLPLLFLCDTPGMMVGPEAERTGLVRHCSRLFVVGANLTVPFFTIVLRKMYGLGGQAMAGGSTKAPLFTVAWPTGEFGGMGLEGSVKLGYRNELAAVEDPAEREALFEQMVARAYEHGKAVNTASHFEIDDVIDPADSRRWIIRALRSVPAPPARAGKKRPNIDTW
jgi:acetyl/propionyl-CoA carboxylase alpha subunit/acetyl-CoA carboxylase carboxyltransferase component